MNMCINSLKKITLTSGLPTALIIPVLITWDLCIQAGAMLHNLAVSIMFVSTYINDSIAWNALLTLDDVIKWRHFPRYWPFVRGIHPPVTGGFSSQRPVTRSIDVLFDLRLNKRWANNRDGGHLRCHRAYYDVTLMIKPIVPPQFIMTLRNINWQCTFRQHGRIMGNLLHVLIKWLGYINNSSDMLLLFFQ